MFSLYVARRYLFARKSHHTIGIISAISVAGVALATMALVVTLSVFNGFRDMVASFFTAFDPQLKVTVAQGKTIAADDSALVALRQRPDVAVATDVLEDQALIVAADRQIVCTIKGVEDNFLEQGDLASQLYGDGEPVLHAAELEYGILGIRLASQLGLSTDFDGELPIYAPRRGERVNLANPVQSFNTEYLLSPGVVFAVNQAKYDSHYIITSIGFARRLLEQQGRLSGVELRLRPGTDADAAERDIARALGPRFVVSNRYEQQEDVFRIMRVEKFIAYLFLTFILLVASFNIIGSLSMLMLDKRADMATLRSLGADEAQIARIFVIEGWLISALGAVIGIAAGLLACYLQQTYGIITMGNTAGAFVVDAYPVSVHAADIAVIFATVLATSLVAVWLPVRRLTRTISPDRQPGRPAGI